jgi:hypothetical protein
MSGSEAGSTNTIDQLLGHTNGPTTAVEDRVMTRARSSAYIVHGNFDRLAQMYDDITTDGAILVAEGTNETDVSNEIHRRSSRYIVTQQFLEPVVR